MDLTDLNLDLLLSLEALLTERSLSGASIRLEREPARVQTQLQRLQELFQDPLLLEGGLLTRRASELLPELRLGLRALRTLTASPPTFSPETSTRTFHLAASHHYRLLALPALLRSLPPRLSLSVATTTEARGEDLATGTLDFVIGTIEQAPLGQLARQGLWEERRTCLISAARGGLDLDTFCARPHIRLTSAGAVDVVGKVLEHHGRRRQVCIQLPDPLGVAAIVAQSDAVVVLPERLAALLAAYNPSVRVCEPPIPLPGLGVYLFWHPSHGAEPGRVWLRDRIAAQIPL